MYKSFYGYGRVSGSVEGKERMGEQRKGDIEIQSGKRNSRQSEIGQTAKDKDS